MPVCYCRQCATRRDLPVVDDEMPLCAKAFEQAANGVVRCRGKRAVDVRELGSASGTKHSLMNPLISNPAGLAGIPRQLGTCCQL